MGMRRQPISSIARRLSLIATAFEFGDLHVFGSLARMDYATGLGQATLVTVPPEDKTGAATAAARRAARSRHATQGKLTFQITSRGFWTVDDEHKNRMAFSTLWMC